jgi:hypothetical protein
MLKPSKERLILGAELLPTLGIRLTFRMHYYNSSTKGHVDNPRVQIMISEHEVMSFKYMKLDINNIIWMYIDKLQNGMIKLTEMDEPDQRILKDDQESFNIFSEYAEKVRKLCTGIEFKNNEPIEPKEN